MPELTVTELEARLSDLEQNTRWLKWGLVVTAVVSFAGFMSVVLATKFQSQSQPATAQTEQIVIKDKAGKVRMILGKDEKAEGPQGSYGLFIYGEDGNSEATLTDSSLDIDSGKGSAQFSPMSIDIRQYKNKITEIRKRASKFVKDIETLEQKVKSPGATTADKAAVNRIVEEHRQFSDPETIFYLNLSGPYIELIKRSDDAFSGAGRAQIGVSPYPSLLLSSSEDKTSFSLSAVKGSAGMTIRDGEGNKRAGLEVDSADGATINLYDRDGKTTRATFGSVALQTIRTGGIQQRPAALVLFDKEGKVIWSTP